MTNYQNNLVLCSSSVAPQKQGFCLTNPAAVPKAAGFRAGSGTKWTHSFLLNDLTKFRANSVFDWEWDTVVSERFVLRESPIFLRWNQEKMSLFQCQVNNELIWNNYGFCKINNNGSTLTLKKFWRYGTDLTILYSIQIINPLKNEIVAWKHKILYFYSAL